MSNRPAIGALILDPTGGVPSTISLNKIRVPNGSAPTDCWQFRRNLETAEYTRCLERHIRSRNPARLKDTYREKSLLYTDFRALRADFHLSSSFDLARGRRADDVYGWRQAALPMARLSLTNYSSVYRVANHTRKINRPANKVPVLPPSLEDFWTATDRAAPQDTTRYTALDTAGARRKRGSAYIADDSQRSGIKSTAKKAMQYQQDM